MQKNICFLIHCLLLLILFIAMPGYPSYCLAVNKNKTVSLTDLPRKTKVIDLTQTLNEHTPSYGGKEGEFKYETLSRVEKDGYGSGTFFTHEHLGTHIDAPIHFCVGGKSVDKLDPNDLFLPAVVIDVRDEVKKNPDYLLTVEKIRIFEDEHYIAPHSAVLLLTGWSNYYSDQSKYRNADDKGKMHFPGFSFEAAKYLVDGLKIAALGIDTLSIDNGSSNEFPVHKFVLSKELFMAENLTNLDQLPSTGAAVIFAPLKIENGTGSPARVLALIGKTK